MVNAPTTSPEEREYTLVDMTSPYSALVFPVLELIIVTGVMWMGIGYLDSPHVLWPVDVNVRNSLVGVWLLLVLWRCVLPVIRLRRRRIVVTNRRLSVREAGLRSSTFTVALPEIYHIQRKRSTITLVLRGYDRPLVLTNVARAKRVTDVLTTAMMAAQPQDPLGRGASVLPPQR